MPDDELKSAWELALEKLKGRQDLQVEKLTDEQKNAIAEVRKKYKARIAEVEIHYDSKVRQVISAGAYDQVATIRSQLLDEKNRLNREMEKEVEKIHKPSG